MTIALPLTDSSTHSARLSVRPSTKILRRSDVDDALLAQWRALANAAGQGNPFYEHWYLLPSLDAFDPSGKVRLFAVFDGSAGVERLVGLLPITRANRYGRWPIAHLTNWMHPNIFLGQPLIAAGHEAAFWQALVRECDAKAGSAMFLHINRHYGDGASIRALQSVAVEHARPFAEVQSEERAMLAIDGTLPETYAAASLTGKKRKELRRQANRLSDLGTVTHQTRTGKEAALGLDAWINMFLVLEEKGWKGRAGSALACDPRNVALLREALRGAAAARRLQLLDIRLDGQAIAMLANFLTPPTAFSFKTAYDEDYARFSPGVLLQMDNLALLNHPDLTSADSCAAPDHPMIDSIWRERCTVGRYSIGIGGGMRRRLFAALLNAETRRMKPSEHVLENNDVGKPHLEDDL